MKINLINIRSYIVGNYRHYKDNLIGSPEYLKEQVYYRLYVCKDDCVVTGACKYCKCPPYKKSWVNTSCNGGERFPNLMDKPDWEKFKEDNRIEIEMLKNVD